MFRDFTEPVWVSLAIVAFVWGVARVMSHWARRDEARLEILDKAERIEAGVRVAVSHGFTLGYAAGRAHGEGMPITYRVGGNGQIVGTVQPPFSAN